MISLLYHDIIYRPLLNLLVFFYNVIPGHDIGIVIIVLTLVIRLALAPSFHKSLKSQKALSDLQPKLNDLREKHKGNKEAEAKAMMELYREHKINPLSSCLPLLIQLPILIGLTQVFRIAVGSQDFAGLYSFIHHPAAINANFLHFIDLAKSGATGGQWYLVGAHWYIPGVILAVLAGVVQFWQSKLMMPKAVAGKTPDANMAAMNANMTYMLPVVSAYVALRFPAALALYWVITTLFAVGQQYYILRKNSPPSA
jgi:YidC/Oxa1 family membrane protein insertase